MIYELHVKGFTQRHPDIPRRLRGTYLGLAHPGGDRASRPAGRDGGRTAAGARVRATSRRCCGPAGTTTGATRRSASSRRTPRTPVSRAGRSRSSARWWPRCTRCTSRSSWTWCSTTRARAAWTARRSAGAASTRPTYYMHRAGGRVVDVTGCGNTLESGSPTVVRMVTDSLRYWVSELGVDGFRFDLASTLGRPGGRLFDRDSTMLTAITTDPLLSRCKLIAEPWDATGDGYRVGEFGAQWAEWNGRYRDTVRDFWRGATGVRDLAYRLAGSSDLYADDLRRPVAVDQLRHRARRLHLAGSGVLQRQAQRRQRRGQPGRHQRQPVVELRRRGRDHATARSCRCALGRPATCWPRCCCPPGRRC